MKRDDYVISIFLDRKKATDLFDPKGLVNIRKLAKKYPGLQIRKMAKIKNKYLFYRASKKDKRGYDNIKDLPKSKRDNPLNIAIISYKDHDEVEEVFDHFADDAADGDIIIDSRLPNNWIKAYENHFIKMASKNDPKIAKAMKDLEKGKLLWDNIGLIKDKEVGLRGFNDNAGKPLIHVVLWHHKRVGYDDYWVAIMVRNPIGLATEIDEDSLKFISAKTGIPYLKWGKLETNVLGAMEIRKEIEKIAKATAFTNYTIRSTVIQSLQALKVSEKKINQKEIIKEVKTVLGDSVPKVYKDDKILERVVKGVLNDYKNLKSEELKKEYERTTKKLED